MQDPNLTVGPITALAPEGSGAAAGEEAFAVTISATAPAAFVWAETKWRGRWSDNGFLIPSAGTTELTFYSDQATNGNITAEELRATLKGGKYPKSGVGGLWSLVDTSSEYTSGVSYPS